MASLLLVPAAGGSAAEVVREVPGSADVVTGGTYGVDTDARAYYSCRYSFYARWPALPGETGRVQIVFTKDGAVRTRDVSAPFSDAARHPDVPGSEPPEGVHQQLVTEVNWYSRVSPDCGILIEGWGVLAVRVWVNTACINPDARLQITRTRLTNARGGLRQARRRYVLATRAAVRAAIRLAAVRRSAEGDLASVRTATAVRNRAVVERRRTLHLVRRETARVRTTTGSMRDAIRAVATCGTED